MNVFVRIFAVIPVVIGIVSIVGLIKKYIKNQPVEIINIVFSIIFLLAMILQFVLYWNIKL